MCLICQRIELIKAGENPYFVKELETGYVVIGDHQYFKGYTLFLAKEHVTELHHMENPVKFRFLEEMSLVQEAVAKAFEAEKMNIELLGNGDAHAHGIFFREEQVIWRGTDLMAVAQSGGCPGKKWQQKIAKYNRQSWKRWLKSYLMNWRSIWPKREEERNEKKIYHLSGLLALTLAACSQEKTKVEENTQRTEQSSQPEGTVGSKLKLLVRRRQKLSIRETTIVFKGSTMKSS